MKIFKYKFNTNQSNNLKILTISDLHIFNNKDNKKLEPIINLVKNNNYDCIFIAGDLIDSTNILKDNIATNNLINKLNYLASLSPIYYCLGNHDLCAYSYNSTKTWSSDEKNFKKFYNR